MLLTYEAWDNENNICVYNGAHKSEMKIEVDDYLEFNDDVEIEYYVNRV